MSCTAAAQNDSGDSAHNIAHSLSKNCSDVQLTYCCTVLPIHIILHFKIQACSKFVATSSDDFKKFFAVFKVMLTMSMSLSMGNLYRKQTRITKHLHCAYCV